MASTYVVNYADMRALEHPVSGAGSNVPQGTLLMPGVTNGTNKGVLIPVTATSTARCVGVLAELHNYATQGDALTQTLTQWFTMPASNGGSSFLGSAISGGGAPVPASRVNLLDTFTAIKMDYSIVSTLAVASATSSALTVTGEIAGQDSTFVYVNAGTGIGQLGFVKSSATDTLTWISALTTTLDSTSKLTKILPLYWEQATLLVNTTTAPTTVDSAVGISSSGARAISLANFISINGLTSRLDPKIHHKTTGLNSVSQLVFYSYFALQDTIYHPIS